MRNTSASFFCYFLQVFRKTGKRHRNYAGVHSVSRGDSDVKAAILLIVLGLMLRFPESGMQAAQTALRVWGLDVVPSLFPYMVFCRMLASRLRASGISAFLAAPLLGLMGGSPSGAAVLAAYAGEGALSSRALRGLAALTGTISPMFLLSTVALWAKDARFSRLLLASSLAGAALAMGVACLTSAAQPPSSSARASNPDEGDPIATSVQAILSVGGCIVFFSVLASLPQALLPRQSAVFSALFHAAMEVSGGLHALLGAPVPPYPRAVLCAALTGFSGLSILAQNLLFLRPLGLTATQLVGYGLLRAVGAAAAMALLYPLLI